MMEMTIFEKLQTILSDNILNFISELENLETSDKSVLSENVQKFINLYSSSDKVINIELLHTYFEYLDTKKISSLDYYEQLFSYLDYCKRNNYNNMYNYDIKKCNSEFDKLIAEVNQLNNNLLKDIREIGFKKRVLRENIDLYRKLISVCSLYENDKFLSKASFELLCDFLIDNSSILKQEEVFSLIHSIVKSNVEKMSNRIKIETLKKHKSKQKKEKILQQKLEQEKMEILNDEPITPVEPVPLHIEEELEKPTENLSDYQLQLIKDAKVISDDVYGVSSSVNVALSMLNQDLSIEERLMIYQTLSVNYDRKSVISIDLKSNVLPVLNDSISNGKNCDRLFDDLKKIVDFYNELLIQKEEITVDFTTCLEKLGMSEELEKCYSADNLLETCLQYRDENQQEFYLTELPTLIEKLIS